KGIPEKSLHLKTTQRQGQSCKYRRKSFGYPIFKKYGCPGFSAEFPTQKSVEYFHHRNTDRPNRNIDQIQNQYQKKTAGYPYACSIFSEKSQSLWVQFSFS